MANVFFNQGFHHIPMLSLLYAEPWLDDDTYLLVQEKSTLEPAAAVDSKNPQVTASSAENGLPEYPTKTLNKQIAVVSTLAAVGLFLSTRLDFGVSLKDLTAMALPYEEVSAMLINLLVIFLI